MALDKKSMTILGAVIIVVIVIAVAAFALKGDDSGNDDGLVEDVVKTNVEKGDFIKIEMRGTVLSEKMDDVNSWTVDEVLPDGKLKVTVKEGDDISKEVMTAAEFKENLMLGDDVEELNMKVTGTKVIKTAFGERKCNVYYGKETVESELVGEMTAYVGVNNGVAYFAEANILGSEVAIELIGTSMFEKDTKPIEPAKPDEPVKPSDKVKEDLAVGDFFKYKVDFEPEIDPIYDIYTVTAVDGDDVSYTVKYGAASEMPFNTSVKGFVGGMVFDIEPTETLGNVDINTAFGEKSCIKYRYDDSVDSTCYYVDPSNNVIYKKEVLAEDGVTISHTYELAETNLILPANVA